MPIFPDIVHHWVGRGLIFLGFLNSLFGFMYYANAASYTFPPSAIVFALWSLIMLAVTVVGQFVVGTGHDGDEDKADTWTKVSYAMVVVGVIFAIIAVVVAAVA